MFSFVNNHFVSAGDASLKINDLSITRGYGVFDFFRTQNNKPLFLDDYVERFFQSAAYMYLEPPHTKNDLRHIIVELIDKNNISESGMRLILTGGYSNDGFTLSEPNFFISQQPIIMPTAEMFANGVAIISHAYTRQMPLVKSINYMMGVWLQRSVKEQGAYDVLYYDDEGVSEFPRANVFIVSKNDVLVTPIKNVLSGVTRKQVIALAGKFIKVEERAISLQELKSAKEVFMTSTTRRLLPVNKVDDVMIGNGKAGPICTQLYQAFVKLEES
jgi:branched-chain amino acid aminotransferase